jgi:hypothetical protein
MEISPCSFELRSCEDKICLEGDLDYFDFEEGRKYGRSSLGACAVNF